MDSNAKKKLIGAIVAAALAIAVYYGLIDQKQADSIKTQADQTLGTGPAPTAGPASQQAPTTTQTSTPQSSTPQTSTTPAQPPPAPAPQTEAPASQPPPR